MSKYWEYSFKKEQLKTFTNVMCACVWLYCLTYITSNFTTRMLSHFFTPSIFTKPYESYMLYWMFMNLDTIHFSLLKYYWKIYLRMQSLYQIIYWQAFVRVLEGWEISHACLLEFLEIKFINIINFRINWSIAFIFNIDCNSFKIGMVYYQWSLCTCICVVNLYSFNWIVL